MARPKEGHDWRLVSQDRWKLGFRYWLCVAVAVLSATVLQFRAGHTRTLAEAVEAARTPVASLFGSLELKSKSLDALPQWRHVLTKFLTERVPFSRCIADSASCTTAALPSWRQIVHLADNLGPQRKLSTVNSFMNRWPYRQDRELYGSSEHWATPREFMSRAGDCEDYAIAKYFALRRVGFGSDDLRIVILRDEIRNVGHAVLAVYLVNNIMILDSLSDQIFSHSKYKHYLPQYSMNETTLWVHESKTRRKERHAYRGLRTRTQ